MKKNKTWNKKDIELLISMKNNRYSLKDIGNKLNITVNCVSKALSRYHTNYIKIIRKENKNQNKHMMGIFSIFYAIEWFNKQQKNNFIYRITENNYSHGLLKNLSLISILIIINQKRLEQKLIVINLHSLLLY